jgi:hypothetical protein
MVDEQDNSIRPDEEKEDSFEFDSAGEAPDYISLDQVRVLAMRTARTELGEYGRFASSPMALEVEEESETEDHYVITLSFRPQGRYSGAPGREQFFIELAGAVAHRQVLDLPDPERRCFPMWMAVAAAAIVAGVGVGGVVLAGGVFDGGDIGATPAASIAVVVPTETRTATPNPSPTRTLTPTVTGTAPPIVTASATATLSPTATPTPQTRRR